jgi:hypothetical protein
MAVHALEKEVGRQRTVAFYQAVVRQPGRLDALTRSVLGVEPAALVRLYRAGLGEPTGG